MSISIGLFLDSDFFSHFFLSRRIGSDFIISIVSIIYLCWLSKFWGWDVSLTIWKRGRGWYNSWLNSNLLIWLFNFRLIWGVKWWWVLLNLSSLIILNCYLTTFDRFWEEKLNKLSKIRKLISIWSCKQIRKFIFLICKSEQWFDDLWRRQTFIKQNKYFSLNIFVILNLSVIIQKIKEIRKEFFILR